MSKTRFKIEIAYDDGYGNMDKNYSYDDMLTHRTIYMCVNNSSDYVDVVYDDGERVELFGAEEFVELLCVVISSRDCDNKVTVKDENISVCGWATIEPISWSEYPDKVKEVLA